MLHPRQLGIFCEDHLGKTPVHFNPSKFLFLMIFMVSCHVSGDGSISHWNVSFVCPVIFTGDWDLRGSNWVPRAESSVSDLTLETDGNYIINYKIKSDENTLA